MNTTTTWRTSSYTGNGTCVELGPLGDEVGVRDTKLGDASPVLRFDRTALAGLVEQIKTGR